MSFLSLDVFSPKQTIEYLQRESGRNDCDPLELASLGETVGSLPLALAHLGAFLRRSRTVSCVRAKERLFSILEQPPRGAPSQPSVSATFQLAIEAAEEDMPGCGAILSFASFYAPIAIPTELLQQPAALYPAAMQRFAFEVDLREDALGVLDRLSLIRFHPETSTFDIHALVQSAAQPTDDETWWESSRNVLYHILRRDSPEYETVFDRLGRHAMQVDFASVKYRKDLELRALAYRAADLYEGLSDEAWAEEVTAFEAKLAAAEAAHGATSEAVRTVLNEWAMTCGFRGDAKRGAAAWRRATEIVIALEGLSERARRSADQFCACLEKMGYARWEISRAASELGVRVVPFSVAELMRGIEVQGGVFGLSHDEVYQVMSEVAEQSPPDPTRFLDQTAEELVRRGAVPQWIQQLVIALSQRMQVKYMPQLLVWTGTGLLESDEELVALVSRAIEGATAIRRSLIASIPLFATQAHCNGLLASSSQNLGVQLETIRRLRAEPNQPAS